MAFYGFGLALGVVATMFILSKKNTQCSYFPNARVLSDLRKKPLVLEPGVMQLADAAGLDSLDWQTFLRVGDIDFALSNTTLDSCKEYAISARLKRFEDASINLRNCDSVVEVFALPAGVPGY